MRSQVSLLVAVFLLVLPFIAWVTHVVYCISHALWLLLIVGAVAFPIGVIHGIMVWFGVGVS